MYYHYNILPVNISLATHQWYLNNIRQLIYTVYIRLISILKYNQIYLLSVNREQCQKISSQQRYHY